MYVKWYHQYPLWLFLTEGTTRVSSLQCQHFAFVWKFIFSFQTFIKRNINGVWIWGLLSQWRKTPWKPRGMHSNAFTRWVSAPPGFTHFDLWQRQSVMSYAICLSYRTKGHFLFQTDKSKNWKSLFLPYALYFLPGWCVVLRKVNPRDSKGIWAC